jgi:hypothetical protein
MPPRAGPRPSLFLNSDRIQGPWPRRAVGVEARGDRARKRSGLPTRGAWAGLLELAPRGSCVPRGRGGAGGVASRGGTGSAAREGELGPGGTGGSPQRGRSELRTPWNGLGIGAGRKGLRAGSRNPRRSALDREAAGQSCWTRGWRRGARSMGRPADRGPASARGAAAGAAGSWSGSIALAGRQPGCAGGPAAAGAAAGLQTVAARRAAISLSSSAVRRGRISS